MNDNIVKIVIINSHSDNRGDEAAQRAMINTLGRLIPKAEFTVITSSPSGLDLRKNISVFKFVASSRHFPFVSFPFVFLWLFLKMLGIELADFFRDFDIFKVLKSISDADIILSAPGGPYFGDLYKSHEISEHLIFVFLAKVFKKPVMIYGPSMGPFKIRWRNALRRFLLNKVEIISLRDSVSQKYLGDLNLTKPVVYVTSDSAFQDKVISEDETLSKLYKQEGLDTFKEEGRSLVGFTPAGARWNYPRATNAKEKEAEYSKLMASVIDYIIHKLNAAIIFVPQLCGNRSDLPLIEKIISFVEHKEMVKILSNHLDSGIQQQIISGFDMLVGNRYHSVIFALKSGIPTVCIAYEHKSIGVMKAVGMSEYLINSDELDYDKLTGVINKVWNNKTAIKKQIIENVCGQEKLALRNSLYAKALYNCHIKRNVKKENILKEVEVLETGFNRLFSRVPNHR